MANYIPVEKTKNKMLWENIGISNDFLFGKVMQDAELCKELLQIIFPNIKIKHIKYPELQKVFNPDIDAKSIRLDVYVQDNNEKIYNIEMQMVNTYELPKRTRYYQSIIDLQLVDKGGHYKKLKHSYIIFICPFDLFQKRRHIYTFENFCKEDKNIPLSDGTTKVFLNTKGTLDDVNKRLKEFLDYVENGKPTGTFTNKLDKAVKKAKQNREWRHEYMTLLMRDIENIEKGMEKGMEKALVSMVVKKIIKGKDINTISYELEEDNSKIETIYYTALDFAPDYDIDKICDALLFNPDRH